jgi:hypothetical protein
MYSMTVHDTPLSAYLFNRNKTIVVKTPIRIVSTSKINGKIVTIAFLRKGVRYELDIVSGNVYDMRYADKCVMNGMGFRYTDAELKRMRIESECRRACDPNSELYWAM